jgi:hypothetical protein
MVAFLDKYRSNHLLGPDCDEVDYNFGTVFHRLGVFRLLLPFRINRLTAASLPGLFHLAKGHFIKILARAEKDGRTGSEVRTLTCLRRTAASSADLESLLITARVAHPRDGLQPEPHPQHDAGAV